MANNTFPNDFNAAPNCTICLEKVVDNGRSSITKLICEHFFHTGFRCTIVMEGQKSPRRSPRIRIVDSTGSGEVNVGPIFSLGISANQSPEEGGGEKFVDSDDDFEDLPPQFQSKKVKPTVVQEKNPKIRNRLCKNTVLPQSLYLLDLFRNTCFGYFLDLLKVTIQLQLIHCLMNRELKHTPNDVFDVELNEKMLFFGLREFGLIIGLNCVSDGCSVNVLDSPCRLLSNYFPEQITIYKNHLRELFLSKKFIDDDSAISLAVLFFINDFLFSYENNEYQISNRDFYLVENGQFNSYSWGLDVYKKLLDNVRHKLNSTNQYYILGGLPLSLQIWIFECCYRVDEDLALQISDSIPIILRWKTVAESPWQKLIENGIFMPTKCKFENIVASEDEVSKLRLSEPRDYHSEILKLEPKGSNHSLDMLTREVIELRKELAKV
ncbi:uncharacterized protein LOC129872482 [Solanum dulcamara]|uniref:uncharacterized protein LOC129872482 n=1 Tax=Solanum dulcamara TaxID=45834 RepID=UPI002484EB07|nr:uncharacterized protein LOC129872482 [Solanum dulcamara]